MAVPLRPWAAAPGGAWSVYREFTPAPAVAAVAAGSWYGRPGWTRSLRVLPDGCVDLVWNGRELSIVVTAETPLRVWLPPAEWVAGIRLRCGVAGSLLGQAMSELPAGATPLRELVSCDPASLRRP